jgi:hypothetical protein
LAAWARRASGLGLRRGAAHAVKVGGADVNVHLLQIREPLVLAD